MCNKMASGDLDSDGKPDLVITDNSTTDVAITIWRNTSTVDQISFTGAGLFGAFGDVAPVDLAIGDLDGDNVQDLLVGMPDKIVAGRNNTPGGINLTEMTVVTNFMGQTYTRIENMKLFDLNADHKKDIIAGIPHLLSYQNFSIPGFMDFRLADTLGIPPYDSHLEEFNGDGLIDIAAMELYHLYLFPNKSTLSDISYYRSPADFIYQYYSTVPALKNTATGDFDLDGKVDIAMIDHNSWSVDILWNQTPDGLYQKPLITALSEYSGKPGDTITVTGENFDPMIFKNKVFFEGTGATVIGGSKGSLSVIVPTTPLYGPVSVMAHGLVGRSAKWFSEWKGGKFSVNAGTFTLEQTMSLPMQGINHEMADMDGDQKVDFAVLQCNGSTGYVIVGRNKGTAGTIDFALATFLTMGLTNNVHLTDLDNDGSCDFISGSDSENNTLIALEKNISDPGLVAFDEDNIGYISCPHCLQLREAAFGDLNNDGKDEIAAVSEKSNSLSLFRNRTNGQDLDFELQIQYSTGNTPVDVAIAEISGDDHPDVVVINKKDYTVQVYQNTSTGTNLSLGMLMTLRGIGSPYYPMDLVIADMDGDGRNDIIVSAHDQAFLIYLNDSHDNLISFSSLNVLYMVDNGQPVSIDIADIIGDLKPDITVSDSRVDKKSLVVIENYSIPGQVRLGNPICYGEINNNTTAARVSDLNQDGIPDALVTGYYGNLFFFVNHGTGDPYNETNLHTVETGTDIVTSTGNAVVIGTAIDETPASPAVAVYPNPASDRITVSFNDRRPGKVTVRLLNMLGEAVYESIEDLRLSGETQLIIPVKDIISRGIHVLEMITDETIYCRKVIIE